MSENMKSVVGWIAVSLALLIACLWAWWGSIENFHEEWYYPSLWQNLGLMAIQYLSPMLIFVLLALVALRWPWLGGSLFIGAGLYLGFSFFNRRTFTVIWLIMLPLILFGVLFWLGRPAQKKWAYRLLLGLPLFIFIAVSVPNAIRVAQRVNDGDFGARLVHGNAIELVWAPAGPGWPQKGVNWRDAVDRCRHLTADGLALADTVLDLWRLPTVEEAVRSQVRHGRNAGGTWDAERAKARYEITPDKETPLWQPTSQIIYWWTATEVDSERVYIIVYNGGVWPRQKTTRQGDLAFRAVKAPDPAPKLGALETRLRTR